MATARHYAQGPAAQAWFLASESSEAVATSTCADWQAARRYAQGPEAAAWFMAQDQVQIAMADASPLLCVQ